MILRFRFLLCLIISINGLFSPAQESKITFNHYTQADGLSDNWVLSILQDDRGFLWIGTWNGLNKFDGKDFTTYYYDQGNKTSPGGIETKCMIQDRSGLIWLGSENGLCTLNPLDDIFTPVPFDPALLRILAFQAIHTVKVSKDSTVFAGGNGLFMTNPARNKLVTVPGQLNDSLFFGTDRIINDILDDGDALWLATSCGLIRYDKSLYSWKKIVYSGKEDILPGLDFLTGVFHDQDGTIWAASWGAGLLKIDSASRTITDYYLPQPEFKDASHNILNGITQTNYNGEGHLLWISGVAGGLFAFDKINGVFIDYGSSDPDEPGKVYQMSYPVFFHQETGLWVGTRLGIYQYDYRQQFISEIIPLDILQSQQDATVYFNLVKADPADPTGKTVWLGTNNKGLYRFNYQTGELEQLNAGLGKLLKPEIYVSDIHRDHANQIWIATLLNGLVQHDPSTLKSKQYFFQNLSGKRIGWINQIEEPFPSDNRLWIASGGGLFNLHTSDGKYEQVVIHSGEIDMSDSEILTLEAWKGDELWFIGYSDSLKAEFLARFSIRENIATVIVGPYSEQDSSYVHITDVAVANSGQVFIGSYQGLQRLKKDDHGSFTMEVVTANNNATSGRVDQLVNDLQGKIWAQIGGDLYLLDQETCDPLTLSFKSLQKNAGFNLNLNELTGDVMAGAWNSFFIIRNDSNLVTHQPLQKYITGIKNGNVYFRNGLKDFTNGSLILPFNENNITVEFTALNYQYSTFNQYAVRMKGLDETWNYTSNESVSYKLPPGKYRFEMKAANAFGFWDDAVVFTEITIRPPFYRTWWFALLVILALAATIYSLYRYRVTQLLKLQKMRDNISRDLHDDIGSSLTNIAIMNEMAKEETRRGGDPEKILSRSAEDIHEVISSLGDIVWNVNPVYDDLKYLLARMRWYASELLDRTEINYTLDIIEPEDRISMNMEQRRDFYLVFKEGLNNLVKYSKATKAEVLIKAEENSVIMKIRDNGTGFDPDQVEFGNGLKNMKQRTSAWKGRFSIQSKPGEGTELEFSFPVRK